MSSSIRKHIDSLKISSPWLAHGFWNTAEHASTRILDAVATLAVLYSVPTERFSQLALAQAWVAPALLVFIAPETVLYRDFSRWQAEGNGVILGRIRALRRFAWAKVGVALAFSAAIASFTSTPFLALLWAFALPLAPQIAGPDRELLRLNLRLKELNFLTLFQRALYFGLLMIGIRMTDASLGGIAFAAGSASLLSALLARVFVERFYRGVAPSKGDEETFSKVIGRSLTGFSLWNHIAGIVIGWMQTMDLFFLGIFGIPAFQIGLYSTVLKLSNFSLAAPFAFSNLYAVQLGRTSPKDVESGRASEKRKMIRLSGALTVFALVQAGVFRVISPWVLSRLSRGRWTEEQIVQMTGWLDWILPACALFGSLLLWTAWLNVRTPIRTLVLRAYVPWGAIALLAYAWCTAQYGPDGAARANLLVVGLLFPLLLYATLAADRSPKGDA